MSSSAHRCLSQHLAMRTVFPGHYDHQTNHRFGCHISLWCNLLHTFARPGAVSVKFGFDRGGGGGMHTNTRKNELVYVRPSSSSSDVVRTSAHRWDWLVVWHRCRTYNAGHTGDDDNCHLRRETWPQKQNWWW